MCTIYFVHKYYMYSYCVSGEAQEHRPSLQQPGDPPPCDPPSGCAAPLRQQTPSPSQEVFPEGGARVPLRRRLRGGPHHGRSEDAADREAEQILSSNVSAIEKGILY